MSLGFQIPDTQIPLFSVFILTLLIMSGYINTLLPCQFQKLMKENIYLKHLIAFLTFIIFVSMTIPKEKTTLSLLYAVEIYLYFLLIMKTEYRFLFAILILLLFSYILYLYKMNRLKETEEKDRVDRVNYIIYIIVVMLTVIGVLIYLGQKKYMYKNKFDYIQFFLGKTECLQHGGNRLPFDQAIRYAFT